MLGDGIEEKKRKSGVEDKSNSLRKAACETRLECNMGRQDREEVCAIER